MSDVLNLTCQSLFTILWYTSHVPMQESTSASSCRWKHYPAMRRPSRDCQRSSISRQSCQNSETRNLRSCQGSPASASCRRSTSTRRPRSSWAACSRLSSWGSLLPMQSLRVCRYEHGTGCLNNILLFWLMVRSYLRHVYTASTFY